jgi:PPOX class probable F420-dependent enzyme
VSELRIDPSTDFGARVERRLRDEIVIWLVTVGPSGAPEPAPVWFLWDGQSFVIYSRAGTPRERNLRRNAHVALHFDGNGQGGDIVVFSGEVTVDESLPPAHANAAYLAKYADRMRRVSGSPEQFSAAYPLPLRIRPTRLRGH